MISNGVVLIQVDPQSLESPSGKTFPRAAQLQARQLQAQVWKRAEWTFRCATPQERTGILRAVENDLSSDINYDALLAALRLSEAQTTVLFSDYKSRPLRELMLEEPSFGSSPQDVEQKVRNALLQEVRDHVTYLSIPDVQMLAVSAAMEMSRRIRGVELDLNSVVQALYDLSIREARKVDPTCFTDGSRHLQPGPIESHLEPQLRQLQATVANKALLPLLTAPVRWLEDCLARVPTFAGGPHEDRRALAAAIQNAFQQLLSQSFVLGEQGPNSLYAALQHLVCNALDQLGFKHALPMRSASPEKLTGFSAAQPDPHPTWLSPEQMAVARHDFRADSLRRLVSDKLPMPCALDAVKQALIRSVHEYREYLSSDDLGNLVDAAAAAIARQDPSRRPHEVATMLWQAVMDAVDGSFKDPGSPWATNSGRVPGQVENEIISRLHFSAGSQEDALWPLLIAQARVLDRLLASPLHLPEDVRTLAVHIQEVFERLLSQSFALGPNMPQEVYGAVAHAVRSALDRLGYQHFSVARTPTQEWLQEIGFIPQRPELSQVGVDPQIADPASHPIPLDPFVDPSNRHGFQAMMDFVPLAPVNPPLDLPRETAMNSVPPLPAINPTSKKRSSDQMEENAPAMGPTLALSPLDLARDQARADAAQARITALERQQVLPARPAQSAVQPRLQVLPAKNARVQASPTDQQVRASQEELMKALKLHKYNGTQSRMQGAVQHIENENLDFEKAIAYLGQTLTRDQFGVLITMALSKKGAQSEHLATLYLLYGASPSPRAEELLALVPSTLPPCFIRYEGAIKANIRRWPGELPGPFLAKLGF